MKRSAWIVGTLLASFTFGCNGRPCCFLTSFIPISAGSGISRRSDLSIKGRIKDHHLYDDVCAGVRPPYSNTFNDRLSPRKRRECHMSKTRTPYDQNDEGEQSADKRGVFKRMREKISTTFGSSRKEGDSLIDERNPKEAGNRPTSLDAIRLRLAMAMSGLSNLGLFQFMKEEWVVACPKTRVGPGQITPCTVNGLDIVIFASRDGQRLDAFANACPHLGSPFDLATIERKPVMEDKRKKDDGTGDGCVDCIVCPVHQTAFEIQSGEVRGEWCPYPPILGGIM
jgi:nitrite reductase/ring-hydroxylating ferredoxin subunit